MSERPPRRPRSTPTSWRGRTPSHDVGRWRLATLRGLRSDRGLVQLDDPLFPIGTHKHDRPIFARVAREHLSKPWKVGTDEHGSIRISSRPFRDPILDRSVESLGGKDAARSTGVFCFRCHPPYPESFFAAQAG